MSVVVAVAIAVRVITGYFCASGRSSRVGTEAVEAEGGKVGTDAVEAGAVDSGAVEAAPVEAEAVDAVEAGTVEAVEAGTVEAVEAGSEAEGCDFGFLLYLGCVSFQGTHNSVTQQFPLAMGSTASIIPASECDPHFAGRYDTSDCLNKRKHCDATQQQIIEQQQVTLVCRLLPAFCCYLLPPPAWCCLLLSAG